MSLRSTIFKKGYIKDSKVLSRKVRAQDATLGCLWSSKDREKVMHTQRELSEGEADDSRTEREEGEDTGRSEATMLVTTIIIALPGPSPELGY